MRMLENIQKIKQIGRYLAWMGFAVFIEATAPQRTSQTQKYMHLICIWWCSFRNDVCIHTLDIPMIMIHILSIFMSCRWCCTSRTTGDMQICTKNTNAKSFVRKQHCWQPSKCHIRLTQIHQFLAFQAFFNISQAFSINSDIFIIRVTTREECFCVTNYFYNFRLHCE